MLAVGVPLSRAAEGGWSPLVAAVVVAVVLIVAGAVYGWIVSRFAKPVRFRPTLVSGGPREERRAA